MDGDQSERLIFWAEWYQAEASFAKRFYLYYFPSDNSIELYDHKTRKTFLRRTKIENLSQSDFYIGAKLIILGRQIDILDYADSPTKNKLANKQHKTFALVKPEVVHHLGKIFSILQENQFHVNECVMLQLTLNDIGCLNLYTNQSDSVIAQDLINSFIKGPSVAMELMSDNAIEKLEILAGPENPHDARRDASNSFRAIFGTDGLNNGFYCSKNAEVAKKNLEYFFSKSVKSNIRTTETLNRCSLCIIKPHAVRDGTIGSIMTAINESGFKVTALKLIHLDRTNCEEFYEVYKGVVPEYAQMVLQLASGPCFAIEVVAKDESINTYSAFRQLCGPIDPEIARQLRPQTIRARFGINKIMNAVHCTDLEEDTLLEVEYFFKIMK